MSNMFQRPYSEERRYPVRLKVWRILNVVLFPILPKRLKICLLRLFGARIEKSLVAYSSARIYAPWNLEVDAPWAVIGPRVRLYNKAKVSLGGHVIISQDAFICTASHDVASPQMALVAKPITIRRDSWVASHAIILPGVTIGEGAVVAAGAVVTKDVEPFTVVGGNPAKFIKQRVLLDN